jgi:hypothetical protein
MRFLAIASTVLILTGSANAFAKQVPTSVGPMDESCVHEVPNGAEVDSATGAVTLNGVTIARYSPCTLASLGTLPGGGASTSNGASGTDWYMYVKGLPVSEGGVKAFDNLTVQWSVPSNPNTYDSSVQYFFPALENVYSDGTIKSIIQPILQWGNNGYNGGHEWQILAEEVSVSNGVPTVFHSTPETVTAGDALEGYLIQVASNEWKVDIHDLSSGAFSLNYWYPASGDPPFNWAFQGVFEGYGDETETEPLSSCSEVASAGIENFYPVTVEQANSSWNAFINTLNAVTWTPYSNPSGLAPNCSWDAIYYEGFTEFSWFVPGYQ